MVKTLIYYICDVKQAEYAIFWAFIGYKHRNFPSTEFFHEMYMSFSIFSWTSVYTVYINLIVLWTASLKRVIFNNPTTYLSALEYLIFNFGFPDMWKESLNSDGHQFHQDQQNKQSPLVASFYFNIYARKNCEKPNWRLRLFNYIMAVYLLVEHHRRS